MTTHNLKINSKFFTDLWCGEKNAEVRYNDRDYQVGDVLAFKNNYQTEDKKIIQGEFKREITHILPLDEIPGLGDAIPADYLNMPGKIVSLGDWVVLSLGEVE